MTPKLRKMWPHLKSWACWTSTRAWWVRSRRCPSYPSPCQTLHIRLASSATHSSAPFLSCTSTPLYPFLFWPDLVLSCLTRAPPSSQFKALPTTGAVLQPSLTPPPASESLQRPPNSPLFLTSPSNINPVFPTKASSVLPPCSFPLFLIHIIKQLSYAWICRVKV